MIFSPTITDCLSATLVMFNLTSGKTITSGVSTDTIVLFSFAQTVTLLTTLPSAVKWTTTLKVTFLPAAIESITHSSPSYEMPFWSTQLTTTPEPLTISLTTTSVAPEIPSLVITIV